MAKLQRRDIQILGQAGFTILEVLLALAVLSSVMVMISTSLSSTFTVVDTTRNKGQMYYKAQVALQRISEDLMSAYLVDDIEFTANIIEHNEQKGTELQFASMAHVVFDQEHDHRGLSRISYTTVPDEDDERLLLLMRSDSLYIPQEKINISELDDDKGFILSDQLKSVSFSFVDENGEEIDEWIIDKNIQNKSPKLPSVVHCRLEYWLDVEEGTSLEFSTSIFIPVGFSLSQK